MSRDKDSDRKKTNKQTNQSKHIAKEIKILLTTAKCNPIISFLVLTILRALLDQFMFQNCIDAVLKKKKIPRKPPSSSSQNNCAFYAFIANYIWNVNHVVPQP